MTANLSPRATVVVAAGGQGSRMGGTIPKQFLALNGKPLLIHTLEALLACERVADLVVVVPEAERAATAALLTQHNIDRVIGPIAGGDSRQASVRRGIDAAPATNEVLAVHDAARPFPGADTLTTAILRAHREQVGVVIGRPSHDTIKAVDAVGRIVATPDRSTLWQAFTPQVFPAKMIAEAYATAHRDQTIGTDDASLVEALGGTVVMLAGRRESLKITTPQDMVTAQAWATGEVF